MCVRVGRWGRGRCVPLPAEERQAQRQDTQGVPGRYRDARVPGYGGGSGGADEVGEVVAGAQGGHPGRSVRGGQDRVEVVGGDRGVDGGAGGGGGRRTLPQVRRGRQGPAGLLGEFEDLLFEERHLDVGVRLVDRKSVV